MSNKIKKFKVLVGLDSTHGYMILGLLYHLQKIMNCEFYAIVIRYNSDYEFWKKQNFVKFEKFWYYPDYYNKKTDTPDLKFLEDLEEKSEQNLWSYAYYERFFFRYFKYHNFTHNEILNFFEQTGKLYYRIFDEIKPDFVITTIADSGYDALFAQLASNYGIKKYLLNIGIRFSNRIWFSNDYRGDTFSSNIHNNPSTNFNKKIEDYSNLKGDLVKDKQKGLDRYEKEVSIFYKLTVFLKFLFSKEEKTFYELYQNYGRSKFKLIKKKLLAKIQSAQNKWYLKNNSLKTLPDNEKFVYYPLHVEPESGLQIGAPFHTDQLSLILNIAKSLPVGFKLFVKEHPSQIQGVRTTMYYKSINEMPNVRLIHPSVSGDEMLKKTSLVTTSPSTTGLEALFFKKPVIVFDNIFYDKLSSVKKVRDITQLPTMINSLTKNFHFNQEEFIHFLEEIKLNSTEFDLRGLWHDVASLTPYHRFKDKPIPESDFQKVLEKYDKNFTDLAKFCKNIIEKDFPQK